MAGDPDIVFIDEPEAFLHPSLQHLLGQQIASKASQDKQIYASTHSPSFLLGCVLSGADVDVVRLTHRSGVATAKHLEPKRIRQLMTDPLFRSVGAANALFHDAAIVVEGDSDRAFYEEINTRMVRYSSFGIRHVSFLNAHNKQGDEKLTADAFFDQVEAYGLFTVRSGELETWLESLNVERSKSKWLVSVFGAMCSDPEDAKYLKPSNGDVWDFLRRVAAWTEDPNRLGMRG